MKNLRDLRDLTIHDASRLGGVELVIACVSAEDEQIVLEGMRLAVTLLEGGNASVQDRCLKGLNFGHGQTVVSCFSWMDSHVPRQSPGCIDAFHCFCMRVLLHCLKVWVQGAGCRVQGAGCRVQGVGFRV